MGNIANVTASCRSSMATVKDEETDFDTLHQPVMSSGPRKVCEVGIACKCRDSNHLNLTAHPFDRDYKECCDAAEITPCEVNLRCLFVWLDADSSGKITRKELENALPLLSSLELAEVKISNEAWKRLDDDGNGRINFHEFAEWAGPRLGLPLGVEHLFSGTQGKVDACGIMGCPCEGFRKKKAVLSLSAAWTAFSKTTEEADRLLTCVCGHKKGAHAQERIARDKHDVPFPSYWACHKKTNTQEEFSELEEVSAETKNSMQQLLDKTYSKVWTRDRKKHNPASPNVPSGFRVTKVLRCESSCHWREYCVRRAQLMALRADCDDDDFPLFTDIKTMQAWVQCDGMVNDRLQSDCNEWYLFHGTSPENAENICHNDFKMSFAGQATGTLYGRGTYFAESITKADEYAKPNASGEYAVILCRALGGRVNYNDEVEPNAELLTESCLEGPYDCIVGDREKCRGTFREFVFYDTEDLYAEYIIYYRRILA